MSFSDLMSSARGPGVIGTLLALVVLLGFGALAHFVCDEKFWGGGPSIEYAIAQQVKERDSILSQIDQTQKELDKEPFLLERQKQWANAKKENAVHESTLQECKRDLEKRNASLADLVRGFEIYKNLYRDFIRDKAKGEAMETLQTLSGASYQKVIIRKVTPIGIQIIHEAGHKRIPYEELPNEMQDRFQFDAKQKVDALAHENAERDAHESSMNVALAAANEQAEEQRKKNSQAERELAARRLSTREARAGALQNEIRDLMQAIQGEENKPISRSQIMRQELNVKRQELSNLLAEIARMRASL